MLLDPFKCLLLARRRCIAFSVVIDQVLDSLVVAILLIFLWQALLSERDAIGFKLMLVHDCLPDRFIDERSI